MRRELTIFDFETTSNKPETARVVQFACLQIDLDTGELVGGDDFKCNPEVSIADEAAAIHGIRQEDVAGLPPDYECLIDYIDFLNDAASSGDYLALSGHNSTTFDLPILKRMAAMTGRSVPDLPHIDTLLLGRRQWPDAPNHTLAGKDGVDGLTQYLGLGGGENAHDALADIHMVWQIIRKLQDERSATVEELAEWSNIPHVQRFCGLKKHKGKEWKSVPWWYVKWIANNFDGTDIDMQATLLYYFGLKFKFAGAMQELPDNFVIAPGVLPR